MVACPRCRAESAEGSRFCPNCGLALAVGGDPASIGAGPREERRVVTSLFCDLVGFTATSETADPEDVARALTAYFTVARDAIERHGGVVEKFIGDAVFGVFGIPVAHEDDPARAVRAGLEICDRSGSLRGASAAPLRLRVGVNTGETFVRLDLRPESGEHVVTGDAVNTAARIQSAAPEQGVAVGARTWEATSAAFEYQELPPAALKGKAEPVRLFHALAERTAAGRDLSRRHAGPFVGRGIEVDQLLAAFRGAANARASRLAIVTGEPGIGKSRIVSELADVARGAMPSVAWRQGRCLPYGDGLGFWALGEIVKAHAGILEADDSAAASARIAVTLLGVEDADWIHDRVLPLVGLETGGVATREELFSAWARYLQTMARSGVAVLVFEDVHWADPGLLSFIEFLAGLRGASILVVVTARPDAWDRSPDFARNVEAVTWVTLRPLDGAETEVFVGGLLGSVAPPDVHATILRLSEGNPLYVEELVRLLEDRDLLERDERGVRLHPDASIPLPDSIQALLAARLDALGERERSTILAAAVIGTVFWPGAVEAVATAVAGSVRPALETLAERELVRRQPESSVAGEDEYAFWHVLARDVAYGALARRARLDGHLAVAQWIRSSAGRQQDLAAVVAHHLVTALELAIAADSPDVGAILSDARRALTDAGAQAMRVNPETAATLLARALELVPAGDPERAAVLDAYGTALIGSGDFRRAIAVLEEALAHHRMLGDDLAAAQTMLAMSAPLWAVQDPRMLEYPKEAFQILDARGPSAALVEALEIRARVELWDWSWDAIRTFATRAIETAKSLGLPTPFRALNLLGQSRLTRNDLGGFEDCERAVELAIAADDWTGAASQLLNYSEYATMLLGYDEGMALIRRGIEMADAHGLRSIGLMHRTSLASALVDTGSFDDALALIDEIVDPTAVAGDVIGEAWLRGLRCEVALVRGDVQTAMGLVPRILEIADANPDQDDLNFPRLQAVAALAASGRSEGALRILRSIVDRPLRRENYEMSLPAMTRLALALDQRELAAQIPVGVAPRFELVELGLETAAAMRAEAAGTYAAAAAGYLKVAPAWSARRMAFEHASALLGAARSLLADGRPPEAAGPLASARERFKALGAVRSLDEISTLERELAPA
jgi:class 3 adenylate cyclase/tetratricopeptide (TPR) repeat protein